MVLSSATAYLKEGESKRLSPRPALEGIAKAELARGLIPGGTRSDLLKKIKESGYVPPADLPSVVMALSDLPRDDAAASAQVQDLVSRLESRAGTGSAFSDPALDALTAAALLRARQAGFDVSDELCDRLVLDLKRGTGAKDPSGPLSMLALSVVREGDLSDLRYSFDNNLKPSPLSCAAYALAFHGYGDDDRAFEALRMGFKSLDIIDMLYDALYRATTTDQALKAFNALSSFEPTLLSSPQYDRAALIAASVLTRNPSFIAGADLSSFSIPDLRTMAVLARASEASASGKPSITEVKVGTDGSYEAENRGKGGAFYTLSAYGTPKKGAALSKSVSARLGFYDVSDQSAPAQLRQHRGSRRDARQGLRCHRLPSPVGRQRRGAQGLALLHRLQARDPRPPAVPRHHQGACGNLRRGRGALLAVNPRELRGAGEGRRGAEGAIEKTIAAMGRPHSLFDCAAAIFVPMPTNNAYKLKLCC